MNSVSSRSHAVCDICIRETSGKLHGKLSLVDLAGSERATDTKNHNRQRRMEGAAINQSLLALKECVRALNSPVKMHVPYRASKLTMVLRDSFTDKQARVVMMVNISPVASAADHTHNTLRCVRSARGIACRDAALSLTQHAAPASFTATRTG